MTVNKELLGVSGCKRRNLSQNTGLIVRIIEMLMKTISRCSLQ